MMKEIFSDPNQMCRVFLEEATGKYFIEVVCGGVGMYEVTVPMLESEIADFKFDRERIKYVVREVTYNPEKVVRSRGGWFGDINADRLNKDKIGNSEQ